MTEDTIPQTTNKAQSSRWARERSEKQARRESMAQAIADGRLIVRTMTDADRARYDEAVKRRL